MPSPVNPARPTGPVPADAPPVGAGPWALNPAARVLWRSTSIVQLELGRRCVIVRARDQDALRRVLQLRPGVVCDPGADSAVRRLRHDGFLLPAGGTDPPAAPRLAGEAAALQVRHGENATTVMRDRRRATVVLHGTSRVGPVLGSLLAAAGVGRLRFRASGDARLYHCAAGGIGPRDEGRQYALAAVEAVRRVAPEADVGAWSAGSAPDLAVVVADYVVDDDVREDLHLAATPHLAVRCAGDHAVVGPLVVPGLTSCLTCADLHRLERDEAWAALSLQLSVARRHPPPSDSALVGLSASVAALQALAHLDGEQPATLGGTLEIHLPDWRLRRRTWPAHPGCSCRAPSDIEAAPSIETADWAD